MGLLRDDERGLTRRAVVRAGDMLAPDTHTQALQSLSVTQVGEWSGVGVGGDFFVMSVPQESAIGLVLTSFVPAPLVLFCQGGGGSGVESTSA